MAGAFASEHGWTKLDTAFSGLNVRTQSEDVNYSPEMSVHDDRGGKVNGIPL